MVHYHNKPYQPQTQSPSSDVLFELPSIPVMHHTFCNRFIRQLNAAVTEAEQNSSL